MVDKAQTFLQEFNIGGNATFGIYTTNILKNSDLVVVVKNRFIPYATALSEVEALNLFCVYPSILNIVSNCDLRGTILYMVSQDNVRQVLVQLERFEMNKTYKTAWSLVIVSHDGVRKLVPISFQFLHALYKAKGLLVGSLAHWREKRYTLSIMNILGIRKGPLSLKEECRWAILSKQHSNEPIEASVLNSMSSDLARYMHRWADRDRMV